MEKSRSEGRVAPVGGKVYLHPGQFAAAGDGCTMTTILGSCVGVALHDPIARVGGLNHFLLPTAPDGVTSARYGDVSMARMLREVLRLGANPDKLVAVVVGGACVLDAWQGRAATLGQGNVDIAERLLADAGVWVADRQVHGTRGRRLTFEIGAGLVKVREL